MRRQGPTGMYVRCASPTAMRMRGTVMGRALTIEEECGLSLADAQIDIRADDNGTERFAGHAAVFNVRTAIGNPCAGDGQAGQCAGGVLPGLQPLVVHDRERGALPGAGVQQREGVREERIGRVIGRHQLGQRVGARLVRMDTPERAPRPVLEQPAAPAPPRRRVRSAAGDLRSSQRRPAPARRC